MVTIHDRIHLMFPQYLPNRLAYAYARASMWAAAHRSDRILTVSEASKRDILHFFNVPPEKVVVVYNAIDERFSQRAAMPADVARVRERYQLRSAIRPVRRQHQAAQEPRAADRGVRRAAPRRSRTT